MFLISKISVINEKFNTLGKEILSRINEGFKEGNLLRHFTGLLGNIIVCKREYWSRITANV